MLPSTDAFAWAIGWTELVLILAIFLLLFGAKRLPEIARAIGKSMREFKKASKDVKKELRFDDDDDEDEDNPPYPPKGKSGKTPPDEPSEDESSGNDGSKS